MNLDAVRKGHRLLDVVLEKAIAEGTDPAGKKLDIPCCRGCFACCYEPVYADKSEAALVLETIKSLPQEKQDEIKARVKSALDTLKASGILSEDMPSVFAYRKLRVPCPFLDLSNGDCLVYEDRPVGCRSHIALFPKEFCEDDEKRKVQKFMHNPHFLRPAMNEISAGNHALIMDNLILLLAELLGIEKVKSASRVAMILSKDGHPIFMSGTLDRKAGFVTSHEEKPPTEGIKAT